MSKKKGKYTERGGEAQGFLGGRAIGCRLKAVGWRLEAGGWREGGRL
jgi:hypothetical protein